MDDNANALFWTFFCSFSFSLLLCFLFLATNNDNRTLIHYTNENSLSIYRNYLSILSKLLYLIANRPHHPPPPSSSSLPPSSTSSLPSQCIDVYVYTTPTPTDIIPYHIVPYRNVPPPPPARCTKQKLRPSAPLHLTSRRCISPFFLFFFLGSGFWLLFLGSKMFIIFLSFFFWSRQLAILFFLFCCCKILFPLLPSFARTKRNKVKVN